MHHSFKDGLLSPVSFTSDLKGKSKKIEIKRNKENDQKLDL